MRSVSTCSSTAPVGMFGLTVSGARATTSPSAWSTNSLRISFASSAASGACSGLITSCVIPVRSRRSTKTSPPWSRRRADPAGERLARADVLLAELAAHEVAPAHAGQSADDVGEGERFVRLAGPAQHRALRADDTVVAGAEAGAAWVSWPLSDAAA